VEVKVIVGQGLDSTNFITLTLEPITVKRFHMFTLISDSKVNPA